MADRDWYLEELLDGLRTEDDGLAALLDELEAGPPLPPRPAPVPVTVTVEVR